MEYMQHGGQGGQGGQGGVSAYIIIDGRVVKKVLKSPPFLRKCYF